MRRWLSADWEPAAAIAALPEAASLIERGGGRMLRGSSFYEDFIKTVLTINTNWSATCRMVTALVAEPGGAAAFAALCSGAYRPAPGERIGVVISGGNTTAVDFAAPPARSSTARRID